MQPLQPVDRLSPELLSMTFKYLRRDTYANDPNERSDKTWLAILHVCARWREVAQNDSSLWQDIVTEDPGLRIFLLRHSKRFPIKISPIRICYDKTKDIEALVKEHIHHIAAIDLFLKPVDEDHVRHVYSTFMKSA